jgi:hypothetical protein
MLRWSPLPENRAMRRKKTAGPAWLMKLWILKLPAACGGEFSICREETSYIRSLTPRQAPGLQQEKIELLGPAKPGNALAVRFNQRIIPCIKTGHYGTSNRAVLVSSGLPASLIEILPQAFLSQLSWEFQPEEIRLSTLTPIKSAPHALHQGLKLKLHAARYAGSSDCIFGLLKSPLGGIKRLYFWIIEVPAWRDQAIIFLDYWRQAAGNARAIRFRQENGVQASVFFSE